MTLSPQMVQNLYKSGDLRPTGEWIVCAGVGCEASADHDLVHEPQDGQRVYVPMCEPHIEAILKGPVEYFIEMHGFLGETK